MQVKSYENLLIQPKNDFYSLNDPVYANGMKSPTSSFNRNPSNSFFNEDNIGYGNGRLSNDSSLGRRPQSYSGKQDLTRFSNKSVFNNTTGIQKSNPQGTMSSKNIGIDQQTLLSKTLPTSSANNDSSFQKNLEFNLLKIQHRKLQQQNQTQKQSITKLRQQLSQKAQMLKKFNQLMKIKYNELKQVKSQSEQKDKKIEELKKQMETQISLEQSNKLKQQLFLTKKKFDELNESINNLQHQNFRNEVYQLKITKLYEELQEQKVKQTNLTIQVSGANQKIRELQQKITTLEYERQKGYTLNKIQEFEKIQQLFKNLQNKTNSPSKNSNKHATHLAAFDQALKVQMKQIQQLKQTIQSSQEVTQKLRDNLISSRKQLEQMRGQVKIIELKAHTERKKLIMEYRLQIHEKDNEINTAFKRYKTLQQKYKNAIQQIKIKDDFLRQHLVGRTTDGTVQQYIQSILKQYTQNFDSINELKTQNIELTQRLEKYRRYETLEDSNTASQEE